MKTAYIVSMFPCWSETFILNELVNHTQSGVDLDIYSLKPCSEQMVHDEAVPFLEKTTYQSGYFDLGLLCSHLRLFFASPLLYLAVLCRLLFLKGEQAKVKIKALAVFWLSPTFITTAHKNRVEHLHAHFATYPALLAWIIWKFLGIPYTFTAHAHDIYVNQDLLPLLCRDAYRIVTISRFNEQFILSKAGPQYAGRIEVIRCGIDLERFQYDREKDAASEAQGALNILSIGRLTEIKGFGYLIEALRMLHEEGFCFRCQIIGDGHLREELLRQVEQSGLAGRVSFLGSKKSEEIPGYLRDADLFVLACATDRVEGHDGIPVVFMEAMAYGTPVIGTRISGIPELIRSHQTGLCAEPEDPLDLKRQIEYFIRHHQEVAAMRARARELIEQEFDVALTCRLLRVLFAHSRLHPAPLP